MRRRSIPPETAAIRVCAARNRRGLALVVTLLLLLALTLMSHGALVLARAQGRGAEALRGAAVGRLEARAALGRLTAMLVADTLPARPPGTVDTLPDGGGVVERLTRELYLVGARGRERPRFQAPWAHALLWAADPLARVGATPAVVTAGGEVTGAEDVGGDGFFRSAPEGTAGCAAWRVALDSLAAARPDPDPVAPLDPGAAGAESPAAAALAVGLLPADSVLFRLPPLPAGVVSPRPARDVVSCLDQPDNWGSPTDPLGPCGERRVAFAVEGSLVMAGGEGQGVLAVAGDLALRDGAVFAGLLLVGGDLELEGGALLLGVARVGGRARIVSGSRVEGRACPVLLALAAAPALRRPLRLAAPLLPLP